MVDKIIILFLSLLIASGCIVAQVRVGAEFVDEYAPLLQGKRVALLSNHTGVTPHGHTLDVMLQAGINVVMLMSPEHGFRGEADAGRKVSDSRDAATGLPVRSLYGGARLSAADTRDVDAYVVDLQDVGLRFYTYHITMIGVMEHAAREGKPVVVFDRPNPNGMMTDGPLLDDGLHSGVGRLPIPVLHGMTMGELAQMANGEGWLTDSLTADLTVIACDGYDHSCAYELPVAPSPNLKTMKAVRLYGSTCLFEGTVMSLGRGTDNPFTMYGHPAMKPREGFTFTPRSMAGAKNPPHVGRRCGGRDLSAIDDEPIVASGFNLEYVIDAYKTMGLGDKFFTRMFDLLTGDKRIRQMIVAGKSASEIKSVWQDDLQQFIERREPYMIYE